MVGRTAAAADRWLPISRAAVRRREVEPSTVEGRARRKNGVGRPVAAHRGPR